MFVRWSNLTEDESTQHRLPGYRDPAAIRRFDAPEALDMRFYEVQAKSVLNRVPERSPMPFRWTINPYRGCSHACHYCVAGDTRVLMADGRQKQIADLEIGDAILGTRRDGAYRRFVRTEVLDRWTSLKEAHAVTLEDGTRLLASGDHRFLTDRGWKHVTGAEWGPEQRPHLTRNNKLMGPGGSVPAPNETPDYRRGYLAGMIRGDGHVGSYTYVRPGRGEGQVDRFRLALADVQALFRTELFLFGFGIETTRFVFSTMSAHHREVHAIRTQKLRDIRLVEELIAWPLLPSLGWVKGFLAGIFDAEGSCGGEALRISNTDTEIIAWIKACLGRLGFNYVVEQTRTRRVHVVRLLGGLPQRMRFLLATDPAITRKRSIEGAALKTGAKLGVVSVERLGISMPMYDITTGTGDFIANGVVSHNCFARPTHTYLGFDAGRDFEREIVVKVNAPEVLKVELARRSWKREHVALGTNTDPYQWVEGRYRLMEGIWEALRDAGNPCSVLTKSPLLLRDLKLMVEIAERTTFTACLSIPTLDEKAWRETEPHTPSPRARLEAVAELNRAGIPTGVLIAPLMPGINDAPHQVEPLLELAREAGATNIAGVGLHLRGEVREVFFDWLRVKRPDLEERYTALYRRGANLPQPERERLSGMVRRGGSPGAFWRERSEPQPRQPLPPLEVQQTLF
jgi:DNA repair photolyase